MSRQNRFKPGSPQRHGSYYTSDTCPLRCGYNRYVSLYLLEKNDCVTCGFMVLFRNVVLVLGICNSK